MRLEANLREFFVPKIGKAALELKQREREARKAHKLASQGRSKLETPLPNSRDLLQVFSPGTAREAEK